jgi:Kef-type K+ transport system membrane component KefB
MPNWLRVALFRGFTPTQAVVSYMALAGLVVGYVLAVNGHSYGVFILMASMLASVGVTVSISREKRRGRSSR